MKAHLPRSPSAEEGDHLRQQMVEDTLSLRKGTLSATLPAKPPLKGEVPAVSGRRGSFPKRRKVAAALSAAVTSTNSQESAPN